MSRATQKAELAKKAALIAHIQQCNHALDAGSLARSYGLPVADVLGILSRNGKG